MRELVFATYLVALEKTFGNEPWADIEKCAERIWTECCEEDDADWEASGTASRWHGING